MSFATTSLDAQVILDSLPLSVILLDQQGRVRHANAAARRLASVVNGAVTEGLLSLVEGMPPEVQAQPQAAGDGWEDRRACALEGGGSLGIVRQWRPCADGSELTSVTIRPASALQPPGTMAGPEQEKQLLERQSLVHAEKLATVGQLAAGMAHEINNPICYVQSNLGSLQDYVNKLFGLVEVCEEIIRDDGTAAPGKLSVLDARKQAIDFPMIVEDLPLLLAESREGVERIRQIVQNLRDFSRIDATEGFRLFDIHRAIETTLGIVRSLSGSAIGFSTYFEELPLVECNPTELNQVLMNILVNATQAVGQNGLIEIHTGRGPHHVWIEIKDNGCGIEEHVLPRIFEPFFTTKEVGRGTGLGLSISYGIIKKHGGDLTVRSRVGAGTVFLITLPVKQAGSTPAFTE
ncbi:MAG TPA: ATP-binding protein [Frateuria sp.]|uniref:ATP-binding protein n=1 Tax=Frateuria sp. TaxID=2211372 RepID=UPI002D7F7A8F|nr:ATP-binding protein [Frateuria sp.]HET6803969.1 ATP-binding protein [Frateuria sp.]